MGKNYRGITERGVKKLTRVQLIDAQVQILSVSYPSDYQKSIVLTIEYLLDVKDSEINKALNR